MIASEYFMWHYSHEDGWTKHPLNDEGCDVCSAVVSLKLADVADNTDITGPDAPLPPSRYDPNDGFDLELHSFGFWLFMMGILVGLIAGFILGAVVVK